MHPHKKPFALTILLLLSSQANAYICFESTELQEQKICYTSNPEKDLAAQQYFIEFLKNLSNPGRLVTLHGEMANLYTPEQFNRSLIRHYSHITPDSIQQIISHGDLSAVFLTSGEIMYFNHTLSTFVFDFTVPLFFVGAHKFYRKGITPLKYTPPFAPQTAT